MDGIHAGARRALKAAKKVCIRVIRRKGSQGAHHFHGRASRSYMERISQAPGLASIPMLCITFVGVLASLQCSSRMCKA